MTDSVEDALHFLTKTIVDWEEAEMAAGRPPARVSSNGTAGTSSPFIAPMKDRSPVAFMSKASSTEKIFLSNNQNAANDPKGSAEFGLTGML